MKVDVVVVGGGLAGLTAGTALAKRGVRTVILERQAEPGGYAHAFKRGAYTFDPAIHYTVEGGPGQLMYEALSLLGLHDIEFLRAENFCDLHLPGFALRLPAHPDGFRHALTEAFPHQSKPATALLEVAGQMHADAHNLPPQVPLAELDAAAARFPTLFRYKAATAREVLDEYLDDERLKTTLLAMIWAQLGVAPRRLDFLTFAQFLNVLVSGTYRVRGGFQAFVDALAAAFGAAGGDLRLGSGAARIHTENGHVSSVDDDQGNRYEAEIVVAACDARTVFEDLVGAEHLPPRYLRRLRSMHPSLSAFTVFGVTRRDLGAEGATFQTYVYDEWDHDRSYERILAGEQPTAWVTAPSLYDPTVAPAGEHVVLITAPATYNVTPPWQERRDDARRNLLKLADRAFPGLADDLEIASVGTPATLARYTGNQAGAMLGWAATPEQSGSRRLSIRTPIEGLYLAGHWTQPGQGSLRVVVSGFWAAQEILRGKAIAGYDIPLSVKRLW